jgi:hypothetical protein
MSTSTAIPKGAAIAINDMLDSCADQLSGIDIQ